MATLLARVREPILPFPWQKNSWNPWLVLLTFFGLIVINVVPAVGYVVWYNMAHLHIHGAMPVVPPALNLLLLQIATYVPIAAFLLAIVPPIAKSSFAELGFRMPTQRDLKIGVAGAIVMLVTVLAASQIVAALVHHHDTETAVEMLKQVRTPFGIFIFVLLASVLAPLIEELTFRVFIFGALTRWLPVPAAAIISGIFFGSIHAATLPQLVTVGIPLTLGGVILAYVYAKSRCFWSSVITHATFNTVNVALLLIFHIN